MVIANHMLAYTDLDKIWFVVSPHNPLKQKSSLLDERQRLQMVTLAIGDNNKVLDERELEVEIHPPFWNTILAKLIGFVLLLLVLYWTYNYLSNLFEKKRTTEKIKFFIIESYRTIIHYF